MRVAIHGSSRMRCLPPYCTGSGKWNAAHRCELPLLSFTERLNTAPIADGTSTAEFLPPCRLTETSEMLPPCCLTETSEFLPPGCLTETSEFQPPCCLTETSEFLPPCSFAPCCINQMVRNVGGHLVRGAVARLHCLEHFVLGKGGGRPPAVITERGVPPSRPHWW